MQHTSAFHKGCWNTLHFLHSSRHLIPVTVLLRTPHWLTSIPRIKIQSLTEHSSSPHDHCSPYHHWGPAIPAFFLFHTQFKHTLSTCCYLLSLEICTVHSFISFRVLLKDYFLKRPAQITPLSVTLPCPNTRAFIKTCCTCFLSATPGKQDARMLPASRTVLAFTTTFPAQILLHGPPAVTLDVFVKRMSVNQVCE